MNTYLVICGIILNIFFILMVALVIVVLIVGIIDDIKCRKKNKKKAAREAQRQLEFKEELVLAKQAWQEWAKKIDNLRQNYNSEGDYKKRSKIEMEIFDLQYHTRYHFTSVGRNMYLYTLGEEYKWVLQNETTQ